MSITTAFALGKLKLLGVFNSLTMAGLQLLYKSLLPVTHEKKITVSSQPQQCPECKNELGVTNALYSRIAVCDHCSYHFVWSAPNRVEHLADPGTFRSIGHAIQSVDFLGFVDEQSYSQRL